MIPFARWKIWTIAAVCFCGVLFAIPNLLSPNHLALMPEWLKSTINLGLELRGGSHLQLEVDMKSVLKDQSENLLDEVRTALRASKTHKIQYMGLSLTPDRTGVTFVLKDPAQQESIQKLLKHLADESTLTTEADGRVTLTLTENAINEKAKQALEQSIEVIRHRIDESGTKEPTIQRQGKDRILVQLPGVDDPKAVQRLIGRTAKLEFRMVDDQAGSISIGENGRPKVDNLSSGSEIIPFVHKDKTEGYVVVKKQVSIAGDHLSNASLGYNEGQVGVSIAFDSIGTKKFYELTSKNLGKQFAIILDNKAISVATFAAIISDGKSIITGGFDSKSASELALLLRAGALPAPLHVMEERTIGPSLGEDSIHDGKRATIFAFIFVAVFMILSYARFGFFADIALAFNLILLFAALSLLQATLTLPGIAGIALTIGMAVDANVLIYERIKEELRNGLRPIAAVELGYSRAFTTIIDSNLTTLIGAAVLFEFGSGPIRGFAVTLALGIIISLFTALSLTRYIIHIWMKRQVNLNTLPI
jgi:preprotein translocase subunit SecD